MLVLLATTSAPPVHAARTALTPGALHSTSCVAHTSLSFNNYPDSSPVKTLTSDTGGRVYVAGFLIKVNGVQGPGLVRLHPNGTRDSTFSARGFTKGSPQAMAVWPGGRTLVVVTRLTGSPVAKAVDICRFQ